MSKQSDLSEEVSMLLLTALKALLEGRAAFVVRKVPMSGGASLTEIMFKEVRVADDGQ